MPPAVETMMYAGETPWHRDGKRVPTEVGSDEVDGHAGLDWQVLLKTVQVAGGGAIPGFRAVVRSSDKRTLGIVSDLYQPIQHKTMRQVCDTIIGESGAFYHTAGSLNGGEDVWYLLKLPTSLKLGNDITEDYLLATTNHIGKRKFRVLPTKIRVVCQNTLNMALTAGAGEGIAISHFGDAEGRIKDAIRVIKANADYTAKFNAVAERMYAFQYKAAHLKELVETLFPTKAPADGEEPAEPHWLTMRQRETVSALFTDGKGHDQIAGTAWAALNAVAEWTDWTRGKDENRVSNAWFGDGRRMKQKAFAVITRQMAA